jgi:anti-sigma B factor antagonist
MSVDPVLTVRVSELAGYVVVSATGSIDATTRAVLDEQLGHSLERTRQGVIVDLSEVDFCDSTGLDSFVQARRKATTRGLIVVIAGLRDRVAYVFGITQLKEAFHAQPDLVTALQWLEYGNNGRAVHGPLPDSPMSVDWADHRPAVDEPEGV